MRQPHAELSVRLPLSFDKRITLLFHFVGVTAAVSGTLICIFACCRRLCPVFACCVFGSSALHICGIRGVRAVCGLVLSFVFGCCISCHSHYLLKIGRMILPVNVCFGIFLCPDKPEVCPTNIASVRTEIILSGYGSDYTGKFRFLFFLLFRLVSCEKSGILGFYFLVK